VDATGVIHQPMYHKRQKKPILYKSQYHLSTTVDVIIESIE